MLFWLCFQFAILAAKPPACSGQTLVTNKFQVIWQLTNTSVIRTSMVSNPFYVSSLSYKSSWKWVAINVPKFYTASNWQFSVTSNGGTNWKVIYDRTTDTNLNIVYFPNLVFPFPARSSTATDWGAKLEIIP